MSDGDRPAQSRERPRRRRGCLVFGCLIPTVLVLGLGVAAFVFGRAYVRERLDTWRAEAPLVDLAFTALDVGNDGSSGVLEPVKGSQDPGDLPEDIPVLAGADPVVNITGDSVVVYQETGDAPDEVGRRLRSALSASGWELRSEGEFPGGREMVWSSSAWICGYQVTDGILARAEVWIRCVAPPSGS